MRKLAVAAIAVLAFPAVAAAGPIVGDDYGYGADCPTDGVYGYSSYVEPATYGYYGGYYPRYYGGYYKPRYYGYGYGYYRPRYDGYGGYGYRGYRYGGYGRY
jgi:hypothetical protein